MPAERVSMRRVREILRLKFECGRSDRAIAVAVSVARSTVQLCLSRFAAAGLSWPLPVTLIEQGLEALLFAPLGGSSPGLRRKTEPDLAAIHRELRHTLPGELCLQCLILPHMPVVEDLVPDLSQVYARLADRAHTAPLISRLRRAPKSGCNGLGDRGTARRRAGE